MNSVLSLRFLVLFISIISLRINADDECKFKFDTSESQLIKKCSNTMTSTVTSQSHLPLKQHVPSAGDKCIEEVTKSFSTISRTDFGCKSSYQCSGLLHQLKHCPSGAIISISSRNALIDSNRLSLDYDVTKFPSCNNLLVMIFSQYFWKQGMQVWNHSCEVTGNVEELTRCIRKKLQNRHILIEHNTSKNMIVVGSFSGYSLPIQGYGLHMSIILSESDSGNQCSLNYFIENVSSVRHAMDWDTPEAVMSKVQESLCDECSFVGKGENVGEYKIDVHNADSVHNRVNMVFELEYKLLQQSTGETGVESKKMNMTEFIMEMLCLSVCERKSVF